MANEEPIHALSSEQPVTFYQPVVAQGSVSVLSLIDNGKDVVRIYTDGRVEFGDGYRPSDAAKIFWQAVRWYFPGTEDNG